MLLRKPCGLSTLINTFRRMLEEKPAGWDGIRSVAEEAEGV